MKQNLNLCLAELEKNTKEDNQLKKDEIEVQTEKATIIPQFNQEEEDLKLKLKQAKNEIREELKILL